MKTDDLAAENRTGKLLVSLQVELPPDPQEAEARELRSGDLCPRCRAARMDYDGLLNLACPACGYARGGCFT
ncbi:MAG TPA: hypothetical protein VLS48_06075 [Anaerolineales bacterium]|nr:hypothetical protein [Anaerolineales bacterium]